MGSRSSTTRCDRASRPRPRRSPNNKRRKKSPVQRPQALSNRRHRVCGPWAYNATGLGRRISRRIEITPRPVTAMSDFHRVRRLPPYVFEQVNKLKAKARAGGADIVDLGMGNPDLPAPKHVIDKLIETVGKPRTDRYSASKGIAGLRRAQAGYYARRFGVKLDPETQVVATLGSKQV